MTFENFEFINEKQQQIIEVKHKNKTYDLHNAAEFTGYNYDVKNREFNLNWNYYWNNTETDIIPIQFSFNKVNLVEILPRDNEVPETEDDCLEQIYLNENLVFVFMSGVKIKVNSDTVIFNVDKK